MPRDVTYELLHGVNATIRWFRNRFPDEDVAIVYFDPKGDDGKCGQGCIILTFGPPQPRLPKKEGIGCGKAGFSFIGSEALIPPVSSTGERIWRADPYPDLTIIKPSPKSKEFSMPELQNKYKEWREKYIDPCWGYEPGKKQCQDFVGHMYGDQGKTTSDYCPQSR